jgi:hypothetical protein
MVDLGGRLLLPVALFFFVAGCATKRPVVRATPIDAPRTGEAVRAKAASAKAASATVAATASRIAASGTASLADLLQIRLEAEGARDMVDALSRSLLEHELNWQAYSKRVEADRAEAWLKVEAAKQEVDRLNLRESRRAGQVFWAVLWGWWLFAFGCLLSRAHPYTAAFPAWVTGGTCAAGAAVGMYLASKSGNILSALRGWLF